MKLSFLSLPYAIYLASKFVSTTGKTDANSVSTTGKTDTNFVSTAGTNDGFLSLNNLDPKDEYIVDFEDGKDEAGFALLSQKSSSGDLVIKAEFNLFGEALIETTATVAADILKNEYIKAVELNKLDLNALGWKDDDQIVKTKLRSGERRLNEETPYGIPMVQADEPFPQLPPSDYFKVCVVDTGYDNTHEDLPILADDAGFDQYGDEWAVDGNSHGTHCAGTIGAIGLNSKGVTSVLNANTNSFTNFYIGKGLSDSGSGSTAGVIAAMEACGNAGAKVISMSLGGGGFSQSFNDAAKALFQDGVLLIAAAGNSGNSAYSYPASYDWIMSVAAVDAGENRASFSQFNDQVEISGPGVGVKSTVPGNSYSSYSGTSMATPHVAGVAALVWSHFPECTPFQIRTALVKSAKVKGNGCNNNYGWGIVQAKAAYDLLNDGGCDGIADPGVNDGFSGGCAFSEPAPTAAPTPCPYSDNLVVDILTDNYPGETTWTLEKDSETIDNGSYVSASTPHSTEVCLAPGEYTWTLKDSYGDGICCAYGSGSFELKLNGDTMLDGDEFGSSVSHTFTVGSSSPPTTAEPTPNPTSAPTTSSPTTAQPTPNPTSAPTTFSPTTAEPTPNPTSAPTTSSPTTAQPTPNPTSAPTTFSPTTAEPTSIPPTSSPPTDWTEIFFNDFETGLQDFKRPENPFDRRDAKRARSVIYNHTPGNGSQWSLKIQDNDPNSSYITSDEFDTVSYNTLQVDFWFKFKSMDNSNEDFYLEALDDDGDWHEIGRWAKDEEDGAGGTYKNDEHYHVLITPINWSSASIKLKFTCDASGNNDKVFIDDVKLSGA